MKKRIFIYFVAAASGAAVMALEFAGLRLIEPVLGGALYVWGAQIGILMGALALGGWLGGRSADKRPRFSTLSLFFWGAALWIFSLPAISGPVLHWCEITWDAAPRFQAVAASLLLYAIPGILLGSVTPFLNRLGAVDVEKFGRFTGKIYAWGTIGSVAGTFAVAFYLTGTVGTLRILWGTGMLAALLALGCMGRSWRTLGFGVPAAILLAVLGVFSVRYAENARRIATVFPAIPANAEMIRREAGKTVAVCESDHHLIRIFESNFDYGSGKLLPEPYRARYMMFNRETEGGALLKAGKLITPVESACGYMNLLDCGILVSGREPQKFAMIGAGAGIGAQILVSDHPSIRRGDVIDVDEAVFELAGQYFGYPFPCDPKWVLHSFLMDGRAFLKYVKPQNYDLIVLDAFTSAGRIPRHLVTREFFELIASRLTADGVLTMNLVGTLDSPDDLLVPSVLKTIHAAFRSVHLFPRHRDRKSNIIVVASNSASAAVGRDTIEARWNQWRGKRLKHDLAQVVANYERLTRPLAAAALLTDDLGPAE